MRISLVAITAALLLAAGCGSSSSSSSTTSSSGGQPTQAQSLQDAISFTTCVRSHGVSDFPDPTTSPREWKQALNPSTPQSPAFVSAVARCQHLLPDGGPSNQIKPRSPAQIAAFLAFARCIRSHGFPAFPDPTSAGELTHQMLASAGINLHQPAVVQVADACVSVTHGNVTKADVARFVAGQ
jgi:hypothetical protein